MRIHVDTVKWSRVSGGPSHRNFAWVEIIDGVLYVYKTEEDPTPIAIVSGAFEAYIGE